MKVVKEENQCLREKLHAAVNDVEMLKLEVNNMEQYSRRDTRNPHNNRREHQQIS